MARAAGPDPGTFAIQIYGGTYDPKPELLEDQHTYGVRLDYELSRHVSLQASLGTIRADGQVTEAGSSVAIDGDFWLLDASGWYVLRPDKVFTPMLGGGVGWAFASLEATVTGPGGRH